MSRGLSQRNSVLTSTSRRSCPRRRDEGRTTPVRRKIRRDGRRRRQRRTGAHESRRRYRHRLGDRCRHRVGDIILVDNNPLDVVRLIRLSKASYRKMQENLVWATGYNVFALPLAAGIPRSHRHPPVAGDRRRVHVAVDDHRRDQRSQTGERRPLSTCVTHNLSHVSHYDSAVRAWTPVQRDTTRWASRSYPEPVRPVLAPRHPQLDVLARVDSMDRRTRDSVWSINVRQLDAVALS